MAHIQDDVMCGSVGGQCEFISSWPWSCRVVFQLVGGMRSWAASSLRVMANGSAQGP
ncbi:uncharacterized protein BDV14DRAFT_166387 [Aspergillus stella-maris]|uniref:uncharacterized protein n=1 Tax=Aspergillus stella-maris TaxID=1810926 RepID=UPI003CCDC0A3